MSLTVEFSSETLRRMRRHARSSMDAEICGVLIGAIQPGGTIVEHAIPGQGAREAGAHVTFTQETWAHIYEVKDAEFPEKRIVGWYHSHPAFGIFLSEHDLFIHENFFSDPNQIAWVIDPHSDEEGCFFWNSGKIERLQRIVTAESGAPVREDGFVSQEANASAPAAMAPDQPSGQPWPPVVKYTFLGLSHLAAVIVGVLLALLILPWLVVVR